MATNKPEPITIDDNEYYNADELKVYDPVFFYGCARTSRNIIKKKDIDSDNYEYGNYNKRYGW
jgi:hypothetical protein